MITDKNFIDWFNINFGYGYGTGEIYTIPALMKFMNTCSNESLYTYIQLEENVGQPETWFLINILCKNDILGYDISPRYGYLTNKGKLLKNYLDNKTDNEIYNLVCVDENYIYCYPNACNCGVKGYEKGRICNNPLF